MPDAGRRILADRHVSLSQATMSAYRCFSAPLERIAQQWHEQIVTTDKWETLGKWGTTEAAPFRVSRSADGLVGLAKPGVKKADGVPRAAHEKIASDLAYHLGLPVPPVVLWNRGEIADAERYVCISAWAFGQSLTWSEAKLTDAEMHDAAQAVSAFDAWISAQDRKDDHLLVNGEKTEERIQIASIDYAYSMSYGWKTSADPDGQPRGFMPVDRHADAVRDIAEKIGSSDKAIIKEVVERIPNEYLSEERCRIIVGNLVRRQPRVVDILGLEEER